MRRVCSLALSAVLLACAPTPVLTREPADLPVLPWEADVISRLAREGLVVTDAAGSKWESFLTDRPLPARFFRGDRGVVEIVYTRDTPLEVRICESREGAGYRCRTTVNGRERGTGEASAPVFYFMSADYFAMVFRDAEVAAVARRAIGGTAPTC